MANALRFHPHYKFTEANLLDSITALRDLQIAVDPSTDVWLQSFDLSLSKDISVYGAIYVAMSVVLDARLVTSDKKLAEKLSEAMRNRLTLLEEFVPPD